MAGFRLGRLSPLAQPNVRFRNTLTPEVVDRLFVNWLGLPFTEGPFEDYLGWTEDEYFEYRRHGAIPPG